MIIKKKLGQNFLINKNIINKMINLLKKSKKNYNCILEIGSGNGCLTKEIIKLKKKNIFIEIDKYFINYIKKKIKNIKNKLLNINILKCNLKKLGYKKYYIIGNFPYYISSKLILWILKNKKYIVECLGIFQKEFVESLIAINNKKKTRLSVYIQMYFKIKKILLINNNNFYPKPKVNSILIKLINKNYKLKKIIKKKKFLNLIKECFKYKRKIIKNSLLDIIKIKKKMYILKNKLFKKRAEQLNLKDFIKIYKLLFK
ncbi:MAG: 16S rRNA (adenine(1518)-N(6)/adenine(1519)-N(6))-dimethyltransferase RsmA [Candidatus Shikimatogenerans bostrichidophilus]|nr:MAG: 16S rRNA (adenine(1518)-N(6)/adenine(1519)-N(6))-dimethyltransferase RsmA [Candidatus Shikimatogenerans bostrichidophilus]